MEMQRQTTSDNVRQHQITFVSPHVVYKLRDRQKKEDPKQMRFDTLIDTDVEKNTKAADIAKLGEVKLKYNKK